MNAVWLLMGLLLLSYIGSFLVSGHALRGYGLPSGSEFVVLGFALGPFVLGLVEGPTLSLFEPVTDVALGWLALVVGLGFGFSGERRVGPGRLALGVGLSLGVGGVVAAAVWFAAGVLAKDLEGRDRTVLALGVGAACGETTRHAVAWVVERYRARGRLSSLIDDLADSDDLGPLLIMGVAFALAPAAQGAWAIPVYVWTAITIGVGVALGLIAVVLLGSDFRLIQSWGVLLGTSLLTIGTAARFGLSPLLATFVMGVTIAGGSRHRGEIVAMVAPTERPVLLPVLMLAGAHVRPLAAAYLLPLACVALMARVLAKLGAGLVVRQVCGPASSAPPALGLSMLSCGAVAMSMGLAFSLRFPGNVGDAVLLSAAVATVFGEFVGPVSLRSMLRRAGEIAPVSEVPPRPGRLGRGASTSPVPVGEVPRASTPGVTPIPGVTPMPSVVPATTDPSGAGDLPVPGPQRLPSIPDPEDDKA
ncbi:cation:proton antiporter [Chondromyces crocatus]|uniref:Kef family potassium-efflux system protein n=1 Tax=Chondromyces crocatus TaxID=52 RepID=A0A0K1EI51_CHOCO|nr:cation:proton antiporter [Chondromyces crocatus]AKT40258.1 Kef family potassium-efflux system protein [Chondromyces crocatus]